MITMSLIGIAFLTVRMFSIFLFYQGVTYLARLYYIGFTSWQIAEFEFDYTAMLIIHIVPALIMSTIAAALWFYAKKLSVLFIPPSDSDNLEEEPSFQVTYSMVISLIGFIIVLFSAINLCREVPQYILHSIYTQSPLNIQYISNSLAEVIRLLFGIFMIVKVSSIRNLLTYFAEKGNREKQNK